jgi:hypothetical protein
MGKGGLLHSYRLSLDYFRSLLGVGYQAGQLLSVCTAALSTTIAQLPYALVLTLIPADQTGSS